MNPAMCAITQGSCAFFIPLKNLRVIRRLSWPDLSVMLAYNKDVIPYISQKRQSKPYIYVNYVNEQQKRIKLY